MATELNITLVRGDTYSRRFTFTSSQGPTDLTGSTWRAHIRRSEDASLSESFDVSTADADEGVIVISLSATDSAALSGDYKWDLERTVTATGEVTTYFAGRVRVKKDASHA